MDLKAKLRELAELSLLRPDQFLVDVVASAKNLSKITVIVDGDNGITIEDCSQISHELSQKLDEVNIGIERYVLEVTSPGLDQPLKLKRQFIKNTGRNLKVHTREKEIVQGTLLSASDAGVVIKGKSQEVTVPFEEIEKAFVMISFK